MIDRRTLILTGAAALALPAMPVLAKPLDYTDGLVDTHLAKGDTVFLDFKASWCGTCRAQERVLDALKADNPAYEKNVTFINVDWDQYKNATLTQMLEIPRRSTLVVLKGDQELGRIVADTSQASIKKLMDTALAAATNA